jgi:hypothetical protein
MADASLRLSALAAALGLYGISGSPTPSSIGLAEALMGVFLIMVVSPQGAIQAVIARQNTFWRIAGQALLIYGFSIPILTGFMAGNAPGLIIRDIIPFFFLLLPILMPPFPNADRARTVILIMTIFIGVAFSSRIVWPLLSGGVTLVGSGADPLYLSIAPTVVFAAIILSSEAGLQLAKSLSISSLTKAGLLAALACLPFAAMAVTLQRAGFVLAMAMPAILLLMLIVRNPVRAAGPVLLVAVVLLVFAPALDNISVDLARKHGAVGMNMRLQEAEAVADVAGSSIGSVIFGKGWGTTLASPAVGGVTVNYTHCLLTALWLKTGLAGLTLAILYIAGLVRGLIPLFLTNPVLALALIVPLAIDTLLYASYKSLDFGLILLLTALYTASQRRHNPVLSS